ncbi:MAG: hypothetical protein KKD07_05985 [Candidatus Omnitrophica bacterium]|nr:hypothetical protein [Candidatus Omnitrophota bacterium]MBU4333972.1 hypothetical protein [Candidatus Omnitrophota bacterium]
MRKTCTYLKPILLLLLIIILSSKSFAQSIDDVNKEKTAISVVYLTGIGCSNCAVVDPILFIETTRNNPNLIVFEYEVFKSKLINEDVKKQYFASYIKNNYFGVPFLLADKSNTYVGRIQVVNGLNKLSSLMPNNFPRQDGNLITFTSLDLTKLPGKLNIWTKNRILMNGAGGDNNLLKNVLLVEDLSEALKGVKYRKVKPVPVEISMASLEFVHAVMIGNWRLQWNGDGVVIKSDKNRSQLYLQLMIVALLLLAVSMSFLRITKTKKGAPIRFELRGKKRDLIITVISFAALIAFFAFAKNVSPDFLEDIGYNLPLPVFTFFIALVDGFNPCNMFVLTCLMALLISTSDSRKKLYIVAGSFILMVYIFYYMFMAAWLNVFKYVTFITPLRIAIAVLALVAGFINCKELLFFKMGISLTISDKQKGPLLKRIEAMKDVIKNGSLPILITSSIGLAILASLIELPCTAGFPIIYTGILSSKGLQSTFAYYAYLAFYNLVYILPLLVIVAILIFSFKARQITQRQMEIIKFIGGIIMLLLGILILVNPGLLGVGIS